MGFSRTKDRRRRSKYKDMLKNIYDIDICEEPSNIVAVCNGGLANGLTYERLFEVMEPFGTILSVILPPRESTSFVKYETVNSAVQAIECKKEFTWPGGGPAYLVYVDKLPSISSTFHNFRSPPGLIILDDFISSVEEDLLIYRLHIDDSSTNLKHRVVKHYGFEFQYSNNRASTTPCESIPADFNFLWRRLKKETNLSFVPDQCTVNVYTPGDGIPPHVDTHSAFTEFIVSLSLLSDIVMDWRKEGNEVRHTLLRRRSLCVMTEESRYDWTHGITPRKNDVIIIGENGLTLRPRSTRISLTFRRTREGDCNCIYQTLCDTIIERMKRQHLGATELTAAGLEQSSVHNVYDEIATHFCETRQKPWPNVMKFLNSFPAGSLMIDVGCGSGRYLGCRSDALLLGCDRSASLLTICHEEGRSVFQCDCLEIPIRDDVMDGCICIAVIHHLSTEARRLAALKEISRILRPGGQALVYVWAKNQEVQSKSSYLKQRKKNKSANQAEEEPSLAAVADVVLPVHINRTNFQHNDMFVPWQLKTEKGGELGQTFLRYYHVFEKEELKDLTELLPNVRIVDYYYDQGNWCIIFEKCR